MELKKVRENLDNIDQEIVLLLAKRLSLVKELAQYKAENNISMKDPDREKEILLKTSELGEKHNLRKEYVQDIFKRIIEESHNIQKEISGK
ncbi:MAG: chorismate mutase [Nanoarchaeota archaeon]|nr:chorismate mutase [Nanoarchaeota archaeon]